MKDPIKILSQAISVAEIDVKDVLQIVMTWDPPGKRWECAFITTQTKDLDPGFIRVQVDAQGAHVHEMR